MTGLAITYLVGVGQGKKGMFHPVGLPVRIHQIVTFRTIGGKTVLVVVGIPGFVVIGAMAIDAIDTDGIEPVVGFGFMAKVAVDRLVYPGQGKTGPLVDLGDVVHDPGLGGVAPVAGQAYGLVVHVYVTGVAIHPGLVENEGSMAGAAIELLVLAGQTESGTVVGKLSCTGVKLPTL